jgi:tRNA(Arg) A34 adenosine deaminase TadA
VKTDEDFIRLTLDIARHARAAGIHPFGAILVGPDGSVLMEAGNVHGDAGDRTGHAERILMTRASLAYWAGVGRVVYGLSQREMGKIIGPHPENLTMDLPCRAVFGAGQRSIEVAGPLLEDESRAVHDGFWR